MGTVHVTWRKSSIGRKQGQKDTIRKLGLRRLGQTVQHDDTPAVRGMINKVSHLVDVREGEGK